MKCKRGLRIVSLITTLSISLVFCNEVVNAEEIKPQEVSICIDSNIFNSTQVRLNTEIYNVSAEVCNKQHIIEDFGEPQTNLAKSYARCINPLIPVAMTVNETGMWANSRFTWTSAIYSKVLNNNGCDLDRLIVDQVNTDTYLVNNMKDYYGCGRNCSSGYHYHAIGCNDNDSLGPLQILRHYVEKEGCIHYDCGESAYDLMRWSDNVSYLVHTQSEQFMNENNWNKNHVILNDYELMALMSVAHNTGTAYLNSSCDAGSLWNNSQSVYDYCSVLGSQNSIEVMQRYVDDWWSNVLDAQAEGESFTLLGQSPTSTLDEILNNIGVDKTKYASSFQHKQYYPLKAVLNYMCLKKLYYSGR